MELPNPDYYGYISIGAQGDLTLDELREFGFDAILVTAGAQGTKSLGLPGEELEGVYHAKDVVYFYNHLPPFSMKPFHFGKRCAIIGAGNVMVDIARHLINVQKAESVTAVVRRGPVEVNFTKEEMKHLISYLDMEEFERELARVLPVQQAIGQDPEIGRHKILDALAKADPKTDNAVFKFDFLASPVGMLGENGKLTQIVPRAEGDIDNGGKIYAMECASCHAKDGKGRKKFPMPIGQYTNYLQKQVGSFVKGERPHDEEGPGGILNTLGAKNIQAILAYVTTLQDTGAEKAQAPAAAK